MIPIHHLKNGVRLIGSQKSETKLIVIKSDNLAKGIIVRGLNDQTGFKGKVLTLNDLKKNESIPYSDLIKGIGITSSDLPKDGFGITSGEILKDLTIPSIQISISNQAPSLPISTKKTTKKPNGPKRYYRFCGECGAENLSTDKFCTSCGKTLS